MIHKASSEELEMVCRWLKDEFHVVYEKRDCDQLFVYVEKKIVGFILFTLLYERSELEYLYVIPEYRNQRIAFSLLKAMEKYGKEKGVTSISLEVRVDNQAAFQLYENFGFQVVTKRDKYYEGMDGYLMVKDLVE